MRPLPRLLAVTNDHLADQEDFGIKVAAIAASGPAVGIVVRVPEHSAAAQLGLADRVASLVKPPAAALIAHGDAAVARMVGTHGLQLRKTDLAPAQARTVFASGWIGTSIHSAAEAAVAAQSGVDYLVAGNVLATGSHPERPARGLDWLAAVIAEARGTPVYGIGGIGVGQVAAIRAIGAYGVAATSALFAAADPARATDEMLRAWGED